MRIDRLILPNYRNLQSFEIDFDERQPTTVLLGRNGTGKSNLMEAIVEIFRDLEAGSPSSFSYTVQYVCRQHKISIACDPLRTAKRMEFSVDGKALSQSKFQANIDEYLPNYIFAYYSGWSSRLERHFERPTRKHYDRILKSPDRQMPLRRLFFCRKEYSQLVLLAFFLSRSDAARSLLEEYLHVARFESALFVLKTPWWGSKNQATAGGDSRFWNARGAFQGFLNRLWLQAMAPIRNVEAVERDVRRRGETTERLYLFMKDEAALAGLKEPNEETKAVFGYLESLFLCDLVDEVRVTVQRTDGGLVKFAEMSEGEQQLLTVLGLLLFTQNDESLYLLDEPDTHLNPVWTYDFLKLLQKNIKADKGQLIIATHNPLMIGGLHRNQVRVFVEGKNGISAAEPQYDPIGIGVEGLLKSELYGLRSTLAPEVLQKLDRHYYLLGKETKTDQDIAELMGLANELNDLGVTLTHPNPYFELFARALAARRTPKSPDVLSKEEIDSQAELAAEILDEVIADEKASEQGSQS